MAKNSRQRRAAKFNLAVRTLGKVRNPATQPLKGHARSIWSKTFPSSASPPRSEAKPKLGKVNAFLEGSGKRGKPKGNRVVETKPKVWSGRSADTVELDAEAQHALSLTVPTRDPTTPNTRSEALLKMLYRRKPKD